MKSIMTAIALLMIFWMESYEDNDDGFGSVEIEACDLRVGLSAIDVIVMTHDMKSIQLLQKCVMK